MIAVAVTATTVKLCDELTPKPIARLINHDDCMWYRDWRSGMRFTAKAGQYDSYEMFERCEGGQALVYREPPTCPDYTGRDWLREVVQGHVDAGNAEWL